MRPWSNGSYVAVVCGLVVTGLVSGCGFKPMMKGTEGAGGAGGATVTGAAGMIIITGQGGSVAPTGGGGNGNNMGTSTLDANCGAKDKPAMRLLPDILIVLDRSNSMNDDVMNRQCNGDGGGGAMRNCGMNSKWAQIGPAINQVVSETQADVNWGLKFFPDNGNNACNVNNMAAVPIGAMSSAAISTAIMGATDTMGGVMGFNSTPTRGGLNGAVTYLNSLNDMNPKFILLATDGLPNCAQGNSGGDDSAGAVTAVMAAATAGYKTFVVGIATAGTTTGGVDADMTLSMMANAGGLARAGTPTYYPVTTTADLAAAVRMLVTQANSCTFQVGPAPTNDGTTSTGLINVFGDGVEIKRDTTHANGYDYTDASMNSIQIFGPLCDQIMTATIKSVTVTFRCLFG